MRRRGETTHFDHEVANAVLDARCVAALRVDVTVERGVRPLGALAVVLRVLVRDEPLRVFVERVVRQVGRLGGEVGDVVVLRPEVESDQK